MKRLLALVVVGLLGFYVGWPGYAGYRLHQGLEARDEAVVAGRIDFASVRRHLEPVVAAEITAGVDASARDLGPAGALVVPAIKQQLLPKLVQGTLETLVNPSSVVRLYAEKDNLAAAAERLVLEEIGKPKGRFAGLGMSGLPKGQPAAASAPETTGSLRLPGGLGDLGSLGGRVRDVVGESVPGVGLDPSSILKQMADKRRAARGAAAPPAAGKGGSFGLGNIKQFSFNGPLALVVGIAKDAAATKPDLIAEMAFTGGDWRLTRVVPVR